MASISSAPDAPAQLPKQNGAIKFAVPIAASAVPSDLPSFLSTAKSAGCDAIDILLDPATPAHGQLTALASAANDAGLQLLALSTSLQMTSRRRADRKIADDVRRILTTAAAHHAGAVRIQRHSPPTSWLFPTGCFLSPAKPPPSV